MRGIDMNRYSNERGAAFVLTILLITLALLFLMTLFYQILNTTKQVDTMGENVQARHIAEMGLDYYEQMITKLSSTSYSSINEFVSQIPNDQTVNIDADRSFKVTQQRIDTSNSEQIVIYFNSEGMAFQRDITLESKMTVRVQIERESSDDHETSEETRGLIDTSRNGHGGTAE